MAIALPVWVAGGFVLAQVIVSELVSGLRAIGVSFVSLNESLFQTMASVVIYIVAILIVIGVPWAVKKFRTSRGELGFGTHMTWMDLLLAPAGFIVYALLSAALTAIAMHFPFYNVDQVQDTGFSQLGHSYEYILAFFTLVIVAPFCEETLFRGYLLGKLRKYLPIWVSILITSAVFGILHLEWNVGVDVFALSIVLCLLRVGTGRLWPSILLHMIKNGIAFFFLFINPLL